jgi:hypothetical protein
MYLQADLLVVLLLPDPVTISLPVDDSATPVAIS